MKNKKIQYILEISTKKKPLHNVTRFHGGLLELESLQIFTTVFLLKTIIWAWIFFQALQSAVLKNETKNLLEKDAIQLKIVWQLT